MAIILVDSPYIHSCSNLSTTATFFCPQDGHWREVQQVAWLHNFEALVNKLAKHLNQVDLAVN